MNLNNNIQYNFKSTSKYFAIFLGILALSTILALIIGIIIELLHIFDYGIILVVVGVALSPFTIILFLNFYLPSKNILTLENDQIILKTYRELRSYQWINIKSLMIRFHPESEKGSVVTAVIDAVSETLRDERLDAAGKMTFELVSDHDKKKLTFMYLKFNQCVPLIEKITEITKIDAQKSKFERLWELKQNQ